MSPATHETGHRDAPRWYALALVLLPLPAIFAPVLFQDRSFAFRDTAVFYYPLYEWIEQQSRAGEMPLWNPHANFGTPVVGEASSALFYPGKLVLALALEFSWRFKLYVLGHFLIAAWGAYTLAARHGSREAAALAAVAYTYGGSVLFQHCNVVYLVGAAWLPWAFAATETMLTKRCVLAATALGVVLAMMVLGGDPQMAYHAGLAAAGYAVVLWWSSPANAVPTPAFPRFPVLLAIAAVVGMVLSAVQVLPAIEATRESDRASYHSPRNLYEAAATVFTHRESVSLIRQGLFGQPEPQTHAAAIYDFSVGPWHLLEYVCPNVSGEYFPQYRRWVQAVPAEPRMWSPSVYLGLLPMMLAIAMLRFRVGSPRQQWLSWCATLAVVASFGSFGLGWLVRQPYYALGEQQFVEHLPGEPVGGLYWLLVTFLPGYAYFRFPAKLLTFAALPICLLAGLGLDRLRQADMPRLRSFLPGLMAVTGLLLIVVAAGPAFERITSNITADPFYGPFDAEGARRGLIFTLSHTAVLSGLLWAVLSKRSWRASRQGAFTLTAITAVDLVVAGIPLIATAPSSIWRERPLLAGVLEEHATRPTFHASTSGDPTWRLSSSPLRVEHLALADRHAMDTHHCLAGPADSTASLTSQRLAAYNWFYRRLNDPLRSANHQVVSIDAAPPTGTEWQRASAPDLEQVAPVHLYRRREPLPQAWTTPHIVVLPELRSRDPIDLVHRGEQVLSMMDDPRSTAVVEADRLVSSQPQVGQSPPTLSISDSPNRVVVKVVDVEGSQLLVLADSYYPGWVATIDGQPTPILRTDRMFRGVILSGGDHVVTFSYQPRSVYYGAAISALGWIAVVAFCGLKSFEKSAPT